MKFFLNQLFRNQSYEADLFINSSRYFTLTQKKKKAEGNGTRTKLGYEESQRNLGPQGFVV